MESKADKLVAMRIKLLNEFVKEFYTQKVSMEQYMEGNAEKFIRMGFKEEDI